jgi:alpha-D-ribose 1-methylphosphonate 5-triphosphate synthase subunit PhnG
MDRTVRTELLARLPDQDLARLSNLATGGSRGDITIVRPPTIGMVMARVQEGARGEVFNLGEVLITECMVSVSGVEGWSMLMGSRPQGALDAATIDAALDADARNRDAVETELLALIAATDAADAAERTRLDATRVQFDTQ